MTELTTIQKMQPRERKAWIHKMWGVEIQSSNPKSTGYPMGILRKGQRIGRIVLSNNRVILELPEIGDLDRDKAFSGGDALEIWDYRCPQSGLEYDGSAERINALIYYFVGGWAGQQASGRT